MHVYIDDMLQMSRTGLDGLDEGLGRKDWNCWKTQRGRGELKERSKLQFTEMQVVVERATLIKD